MTASVVKLKFVNRSKDTSHAQIVIVQKEAATPELATAWTVINNCATGSSHPFTYPTAMTIAARDADGNITAELAAPPGEAFSMALSATGNALNCVGRSAGPNEITLANELQDEDIAALLYRDGRVFLQKSGIQPHQTVVFAGFTPTLRIGTAHGVEEGQSLDAETLAAIATEISLAGLVSADIAMTGGEGAPFVFTLENVRHG